MPLPHRTFCTIFLGVWLMLPANRAVAGEVTVDSAAPADPVLIVRFGPLDEAAAQPVVRELLTAVQASPELARRFEDLTAIPQYEVAYALADRLDLSLDQLAIRLAARGGFVAVTRELPPKLLVGVSGDDAALTGRAIDELTKLAIEAAGGSEDAVPRRTVRGVEGRQIGPLCVAADGSALLIANDPLTLQAAVGRLVDAQEAGGDEDAALDASLLSANLDLATLKLLPQTYAPLALPNSNPQLVTFLGGWIDVLRQFNRLELKVQPANDRLQINLRAHTPSGRKFDPQVPGFWGDGGEEQPAPRLHVPGEIYSATWYRDYGSMWEAREKLLEASVIKQVEAANEAAATQFEVFGTHLEPSRVLSGVGPRFRVVVARSSTAPYDTAVNDPIPAAAACIELQDEEQFREMVSPVFRTLGLILTGEQQIAAGEREYRDAQLVSLSLSEDPAVVRSGSLSRYNFRTTYTFSRGHFIIGTTPEIVEHVIDALDNESAGLHPILAGQTEQQSLNLSEAAQAVSQLRDAIARGLVLNSGWTADEAQSELDVWIGLLDSLQSLQTSVQFDDQSFEYQITIGE
jgi:hypothetical protein